MANSAAAAATEALPERGALVLDDGGGGSQAAACGGATEGGCSIACSGRRSTPASGTARMACADKEEEPSKKDVRNSYILIVQIS